MNKKYHQLRAMLAITKASLIATFRSPSSVIFSIGFPLVFILVFGFIGGNNGFSLNIAFEKNTDTSNVMYRSLLTIPGIHIINKPEALLKEDLEKGKITAFLNIEKAQHANYTYLIHIKTSGAVNTKDVQALQAVLNSIILQHDSGWHIAKIHPNIEKIPGRVYRQIDFILPGQLGFSLLSAGVFSVAFLFFNLRQQLVLKRFFATPIRRSYIVLGEALSRVAFQMLTAIIIIGIGAAAFHYTLVKGWISFLEIMVLSFISLIVFMGYGFVVSSLAKTESAVPPLANLFTLPQFLLAGTFFPVDVFPKWLQYFCNILPLTHFNNAMREISFEGISLFQDWTDIAVLLIWGIIIYAIAIKVFRWQ